MYDDARQYSLREYLFLARTIDFSQFDIYHAPHYTVPFGIPIPTVVTIHDLIHIEFPERFYYPLIARPLIRSAVKRADALIAVSGATRDAVIRLTGVSADRISVIPNAIPAFLDVQTDAPAVRAPIHDCLARTPYFVAVLSNLKPHKGTHDLLVAYGGARRVAMKSGASEASFPRLVLAGFGARDLLDSQKLLPLLQATEGISVVGEVSAEELRLLYRSAHAVVVPSRAEGFCLPALEAQSVGTRVVCRPVPALQELMTTRDLIAEDLSVEALREVLKRAASAPSVSTAIDARHLQRFSLERVSAALYELYSATLAGRGFQHRVAGSAR
jgi:glycosyltransferase involved in cell wall biosynthesis